MTTFCKLIAALFFISLVPPAWGRESESLSDLITQHELRLGESHSALSVKDPTVLIVDVQEEKAKTLVSKDVVSGIAREKFTDFGVPVTSYSQDFRSDFLARRIPVSVLIAPKMVVEIDVRRDESLTGYALECSLSYIEYEKNEATNRNWVARRKWFDRRDIHGISKDDIEDNLAQYLQSELTAFLKGRNNRTRGKGIYHATSTSRSNGTDKTEPLTASYKLNWRDPDHKRNHFIYGASVGTPALFNLHLGFWGSRSFPLVTEISGMYFAADRRGAQLDVGWAFDNVGDFRQVLGVTLLLANETSTNSTSDYDPFGRVIHTNTETLNMLSPFVGPSYVADWKSIRFQGGVGFRVQGDSGSTVRIMFQLGYTPPLEF